MSQEKVVLDGIVTLGLNVKTADAELADGTNVKMSADNEVEAVDANFDASVGYLLVGNNETSGKATVATRGKKVADVTTGEAYVVGALLMWNSAGKAVRAKGIRATATVTIVSESNWENNETVTVNGIALTAGTDFTVGTSVSASALSLADAINAKVQGVKASHALGVVTIEALDPGTVGNSYSLATTAISDEGTVSGATFTGGKDFFPFGMALEAASAADQTKSVLWF